MPDGRGKSPYSGPVPKKDAERRRRNKTSETGGGSAIPAEIVNVDDYLSGEVVIPEVDEGWHPLVKDLYESVTRSGQHLWMEPSDWAVLKLTCESLSRDLEPQFVGMTEDGEVIRDEIPLKGASLNAYTKVFSSLMLTEGDRRRLRLELERRKRLDAVAGGDGKVVDIVQHRRDAFKGA